jgi:hypothetical protein
MIRSPNKGRTGKEQRTKGETRVCSGTERGWPGVGKREHDERGDGGETRLGTRREIDHARSRDAVSASRRGPFPGHQLLLHLPSNLPSLYLTPGTQYSVDPHPYVWDADLTFSNTSFLLTLFLLAWIF